MKWSTMHWASLMACALASCDRAAPVDDPSDAGTPDSSYVGGAAGAPDSGSSGAGTGGGGSGGTGGAATGGGGSGGTGGSLTGSGGTTGGATTGSGGTTGGATTGSGGTTAGAGGATAGSGGARDGGATTGSGGLAGTAGAAGTGMAGGGGAVPDASGDSGGSGIPDASQPPEGGVTQPRPMACSGPPGTPVEGDVDGGDGLKYVGQWLLCSQNSWLGTSDAAGFEFASNHKWYQLYVSPTGGLERGLGFDKEGTWTYADGTFTVDIFGGGGTALYAALTEGPRRMRLNNFGVHIADYIDAALGDDGGLVPPDVGTVQDGGAVPPECSLGGTPYVPSNNAALATATLGSWILCERPSIFGTTDELGIEFTSTGATTGEWFKLYATSTGTVRGSGFDKQGTWYLLDAPDGSTGQMNIEIFGSGVILSFPSYTTSPRKLRISASGTPGTYVNVVP